MQYRVKHYIYSYVLISCGLCLIFVWPVVLQNLLTLQPNSYLFNKWKNLPMSIQTDAYLFNWTNPQDVCNEDIKPKFREIGPFRTWQRKERCNITWNSNVTTITYQTQNFFHLDKNETMKNNLEENVTMPNILATSAAFLSRRFKYELREKLSEIFSSLKITISETHPVREILYDGYPNFLLQVSNAFPWLNKSEFFSEKRLGFFHKANGSSDFEGQQTIGTGKSSFLGDIYQWNGRSKNPFYEENCSKIYGSSGDLFVSDRRKDKIALFAASLGRTIILKYVGEAQVQDILGYKYVLETYSLDNGTLFPENKCFCGGQCVPSGLFNISSSRGEAPFFASLPHFYGADPYYLDLVEGLEPDGSKHEFFIVVEPITGILLEANINIQINLLVQQVSGVRLFEKIPKRFLPLIWTSQKFQLPDSEIFKLKLLKSSLILCVSLGVLLILIGLSVLLVSVYKLLHKRKKYLYMDEELRRPLRSNQGT